MAIFSFGYHFIMDMGLYLIVVLGRFSTWALKREKYMRNFTLLFEEIDPNEMRVVINKYNIIFIALR
jgi:hypothetical protein